MTEQDRTDVQPAGDRGWRLAMGVWFYLGCAAGELLLFLGWSTGGLGMTGLALPVTVLVIAFSVLTLALLPFVVLAPFAYLLIRTRARREVMRQLGWTAYLMAFVTGLSAAAMLLAIVNVVMR